MGLPYIRAHRTGSSFICDPPVLDTDIDIVLWYQDVAFPQIAAENHWEVGEDYGLGMLTFRKDQYNIIALTEQKDFYKWIGATYVAKGLNLMDKGDRIAMFDALIYDAPLRKVF